MAIRVNTTPYGKTEKRIIRAAQFVIISLTVLLIIGFCDVFIW